jgi:hypothetical protein
MKIIFLIGKINYKWSFILIFTSYLSLPKGIKNGSPIKMLPEIRVLPWKFGVCSLEIFEWIRRLHLVRNLSPHVQMIYSLVLKYGFRENPSFTSMFFSHSTSVGDFRRPRFVAKWYLLILFPKQLSTPLVYSRMYQPVPTRTNPYKPPKKMQQSEIQAILCAYNCQLKIRRISPK